MGNYAVAVAWLAGASMIYVEFRTFVAHPLLTKPSDLDWKPHGAFILVPLAAYDLRSFGGRVHPATIRGTVFLLFAEALLLALWGTDDESMTSFVEISR